VVLYSTWLFLYQYYLCFSCSTPSTVLIMSSRSPYSTLVLSVLPCFCLYRPFVFFLVVVLQIRYYYYCCYRCCCTSTTDTGTALILNKYFVLSSITILDCCTLFFLFSGSLVISRRRCHFLVLIRSYICIFNIAVQISFTYF
jgi:hypothetical protein